jgi:DNA-binding MarR family transcriptional regulator
METKMEVSPEACARELLEVVPLIMSAIRSEMRSHRTPDLSVPQFRALAFIYRRPGTSLSAVADHLGLTLPSTSKLTDVLVGRGFVDRTPSAVDRRRVTLALTDRGRSIYETARRCTQEYLTRSLATLADAERDDVLEAMHALGRIFAPERTQDTAAEK